MPKPEDSIQFLPGIGPKRAALFARLGIQTLDELLHFYPREYEDRTRLLPISALEAGHPACFVAAVVTTPRTHRIPKPGQRALELTKVTVADHTGRLNLTFFNAPYAAEKLQRGEEYCFYGTLSGDYLGYGMSNPLFEPLSASGHVTRCIMPVYPLTAGLNQHLLSQTIDKAFESLDTPPAELLPQEVRSRYGLLSAQEALREIHHPSSQDALEQAQRRLVFEEFFVFSAALTLLRSRRTVQHTAPCCTDGMEVFYSALPFCLTDAQQRVIDEILSDFRSGTPMSRLVQGDVGSGKTMVAAAAAFCVVRNGMQVALMAPTEILAQQHFARLSPIFEQLGIACVLLTGSMRPAEKRACREALAQGQAQLVIGTHALLSEETRFSALGLVIADEQHRFGVGQRARLLSKGTLPHLLIMSATPIPRTLALILYGDLDVSTIDTLPPGRVPVETFLVDERYRKRLNGFIRRQAEEGHQTFIVCPAIEEGEAESLKAAEQWAQTLQLYIFPELRVALLHGKMKGAEKEAVMRDFSQGRYDILVSTTVIEVGVDVPNATLMVIENAERFGLSQLHQLRGRIGRGREKSWCILVSEHPSAETQQRLRALCATADGFRIAEEDLRLRGPGDFFGSRQSGLPVFRVGNLARDIQVLRDAQCAALDVVQNNMENLPESLHIAVESLLKNDEIPMN